ncbi:uncharacterized protein LOC118438444 [Folsomia candida]|nr:uncharacterized protein LOC118438444 [Folsomia candida]
MEHEHDGAMDEDDVDESEIFDRYTLEVGDIVPPSRPTIAPLDEEDDDMDRPTKQGQKNRPTLVKHARFSGGEAEPEDSELKAIMEKDDLFKVKTAAWKWKLPTTLEQDWEPSTVHRAATTLRRALLTQPLPSEIAMVAEDEKLAKNEKGMMKREGDDDDELEQGTVADSDRFKKPSWEDIIGTNLTFKEEIAEKVEEDLHRIPKGLKQHEREEEERLAGLVTNKRDQFVSPKPKSWIERIKNSDYMKRREEIKKKNKDLQDKAPSRKYSNIWVKNCPMEPVKQAKRFPHHYRCDESFHAYVVALVGSSFFKSFIMVAIVVNAVSLAVETGEVKTYHVVFDILDNLFLSIYLVEFLLKVYAHPYRYWTSGFNLFDFAILAVSLLNSILVWTKVDNLPALKLLVIFRALRILRGISMSVQIQVLITALVETLKTHVLSVLILLFLLMYITAIIAYYFFSPSEGLNHPWGNILKGMLRLFSFVTLDGWTDTSEEFERAGYTHSGRVFCLVCILLGNFLISNIFIAIIIMQISEATEAFRTRERDEREEIITLKKEIVFRRQKLDMRQLLAKQTVSTNADFYYLGSQFLKLLRHDDLVEMNNAQFSPLWMDSFYKSEMRCHHTANVLMNLHRQMADNLLTMYRKNMESRYSVTPIRRSRYNRYMKLKSKLAIIRQEFFRDMSSKKKPRQLRVNIGKSEFPQISKQLLDHAAWENVAKSGGGTGVNQDARKMLPTVDEEDEQAVDKEEQQEDNNDDDEEDMANRFPT